MKRVAIVLLFAAAAAQASSGVQLAAAAGRQVGVTTIYDPSYVQLRYPGGDVPKERGVCADVIVRAFRDLGVDLQRELHEDMRANFRAYPGMWGLAAPDANIDHRRVPNLMTFLSGAERARARRLRAATWWRGDCRAGYITSASSTIRRT